MIRFQADADVNINIVRGVLRREPTIDFQTAQEANLVGLKDDLVLKKAAKEGRILVTHDQKTMPIHFSNFIIRQESPGVLIAPQNSPMGKIIDDLILIWCASEPDEWINRIRHLPF